MMHGKFFKNFSLKALSVALAISLWFFVTYRGQSEMTVDAAIEIKNIPVGFEVLKQNIKTAGVSVMGHERVLKSLHSGDIRAVVDLSGGKVGEAVYYFDKNTVTAPQSVQILRIDPPHVKITLDASVRKTVQVKPSIAGVPERGYKISSIQISPSSVLIEGPETEMQRIALLRTEILDITGLDSDISQSIRLNLNGRNIRPQTGEFMVTVKIKKVN
jgi:YbbR domain-containing protein